MLAVFSHAANKFSLDGRIQINSLVSYRLGGRWKVSVDP